MAELISELPYRVVSAGTEFYVSVAGEQTADGIWEGWLEYVPLDDSDALVTPTETTQSTRGALQHWADVIDETYVQGAFARAVAVTNAGPARLAATRFAAAAGVRSDVGVPDPFVLLQSGREAMRDRLLALPRDMLLDVIAGFGLNPAGKSLTWLTDRQLVTFIITAAEVQASRR